MIKTTQKTYQQTIYDSRLFEIAKEAGFVYSNSLKEFWNVYNTTKIWLSPFDLVNHMSQEKLLNSEIKLLGYNSYQGSIQLVTQNLKSYKEALKEYNKNPSKFSGKPIPPFREKFLSSIIFKDDQIRVKKGFLLLSLKKGIAPIKIRWSLNLPKYATINWNTSRGWLLNVIFEEETLQLETLDKDKIMAVDLGSKRIATTFDGADTILYSGKYIKSLIRLQNKNIGELQSKISKTKFKSRRNNKLRRAKRIRLQRLNNQKKDFLHKISKQMVDYCVKNNIGTVFFGDCSSIHDETNLGKNNNQQVQQNPEQKLRQYFTYKFESIGGTVNVVPEHYTSQQCPSCDELHKPNNRDYVCTDCGFEFDRDGVGAINIYKKNNVSFGKLNVVGLLAGPIGVKYRDCLVV